MRPVTAPACLLPLLLCADPALAYVGPGSGLGAIGVLLGLVGTLFLTFLSFIWYPVKRTLRKLRRASHRAGHGAGKR